MCYAKEMREFSLSRSHTCIFVGLNDQLFNFGFAACLSGGQLVHRFIHLADGLPRTLITETFVSQL